MVLYSATAIAMLVAMLCGGTLKGLQRIKLRAVPLAIAAAICTKYIWESGFYYQHHILGPTVWIACLLAAAVFLGVNRTHRALLFASTGAVCNAIVIAANHGEMPVGRMAFSLYHQLPMWFRQPGLGDFVPSLWAEPGTRMWLLGDIIPPVMPFSFAFSIGDVLLAGGVIWFLMKYMFGRDRLPAAKQASQGTSREPSVLHDARALVQLADMPLIIDDGHAERVAQLSARLARSMGQCPAFVRDVTAAGLLHEVGPLALEHLADRGIIDARVLDIVSSAHEGCHGCAESRVLHAADTFDQLTCDGPQQHPRPIDVTLEVMWSSGRYDPGVIAHMWQLHEIVELVQWDDDMPMAA